MAKRHCKARKNLDVSAEMQVVTRDLERGFPVVRPERAWEKEAPGGVNELSKEASLQSWRRGSEAAEHRGHTRHS